ncbi:amino acid ABC transporter permease [Arenivirga flava]|uniref:Amino acid ABC transporter permease n=1 Tax=Arenivirga flava TaxID=1930060 RepID=A0AA37UD28_9MICO|nr:amino acid ABC transporter permease [Arenivirga flava]GMA27109.1 amino acid ABC transporter permease [Arenivirga flava]
MDVVLANFPAYIDAFLTTLRLLVVAGLAAFIIGTVVAAMRVSPVAALRAVSATYTELIRNTPLTLVLFFCAAVVPNLFGTFGMSLNPYYLAAATVALAIYTSPFVAEALRSGINGVPVGQAEAARSVGLGFGQTLTTVVLPQAFRMVVPPLINVVIALTKNTSVAAGFGVGELFLLGRRLANANGNAVIPILLGVVTFYLIITIPLGLIANRIEKKVAVLR